MSDLVYQNYNNKCQGWTNPSNLIFGPQIGSLSSYNSPAGSTNVVAISGSYFFSYSSISFGTTNPTIYFINSNNLQFYVPTTLNPGTYTVQVFNGSIGSNILNYTIDSPSNYNYWVLNSNNSISNTNTNGLSINGLVGQTLGTSTNTAFGTLALNNTVTSGNNTVFGNNTGNLLTTGSQNTFMGQQAGLVSTIGSQNTFIGQQAGWANESGNSNVYVGEHSGYNATGSNNTCIGQNAGANITTGNNNACIGQNAGINIITGNNNTCIGQNANPTTGTASNQIILGTTTETVIIPSTNTQGSNSKYALTVGGDVSITGSCNASSFVATSDYRIKDIIEPLTNDSVKYNIDNLKPIKYLNKKNNNIEIGFLAHELQEHFPYLVNGEKDGEQLQTLNYMGLIGILVKEIQQLKAEIKQLKH